MLEVKGNKSGGRGRMTRSSSERLQPDSAKKRKPLPLKQKKRYEPASDVSGETSLHPGVGGGRPRGKRTPDSFS